MVKKITNINVLEPFLLQPKERLHLSDIARKIKTPHPTVRQWLNFLEKKGVLNKHFQGRLTLYSLDLGNPDLLNYLVIAEKNKLINKCENSLILKEIMNFIQKNLKENVKSLIFGSSAKNFNKAGDIDLLVVGKVDERSLKKFADRLNKELHIISVPRLDKITKTLKEEITKKHLLIKGSEDFLRWMLW